MFVFKKITTREEKESRYHSNPVQKMAMFVEENIDATQVLEAFVAFMVAQGYYIESVYKAMAELSEANLPENPEEEGNYLSDDDLCNY